MRRWFDLCLLLHLLHGLTYDSSILNNKKRRVNITGGCFLILDAERSHAEYLTMRFPVCRPRKNVDVSIEDDLDTLLDCPCCSSVFAAGCRVCSAACLLPGVLLCLEHTNGVIPFSSWDYFY